MGALAVTTLGGCYFNLDTESSRGGGGAFSTDVDEWDRSAETGSTAETLSVAEAEMSGDLGEVRDFSGELWLTEAYGGDDYLSVELQAEDRGRWAAMNRIEIVGTFDELEEGQVYELDDHHAGANLQVDVLGCSGTERHFWDYDTYADRVELVVEPGQQEGSKRVSYTAHFDHRGATQQVAGQFEVY